MLNFKAVGSSIGAVSNNNSVPFDIFEVAVADRLITELQAAKKTAKDNLAIERQARKDAIVAQIAALNAELAALKAAQ